MHHNGLFHLFASGSNSGESTTPNPDKVYEQIGWAVSEDGMFACMLSSHYHISISIFRP
jgi:hypothetical protein